MDDKVRTTVPKLYNIELNVIDLSFTIRSEFQTLSPKRRVVNSNRSVTLHPRFDTSNPTPETKAETEGGREE
jgi:hypothetical protein